MRVCALTNVYNESFNLPIWLRHYGRQVGIENCVVIDHGSDDGSTADLGGASLIKLPRTAFNDHLRATSVAGIANSLLHFFDAVMYSDCDEMLVADPARYGSLVEYCSAMTEPASTAIGLNIQHHIKLEDPIDPSQPVLSQRRYAHFASPMCKTLITKKPIRWSGGFHRSSYPPHFNDLFLFHLRWVDLGESLKRLSQTRKIQFAGKAGVHHKADYEDYINIYQKIADKRTSEEFEFKDLIKKFLDGNALDENKLYATKTDIRAGSLTKIPERFSQIF